MTPVESEAQLLLSIRGSLEQRGYPVDHLTDTELRDRVITWWSVAERRTTDPAALVRSFGRP